MLTFQEIIFKLKDYWAKQGCLIREPYDLEKGAVLSIPIHFCALWVPNPGMLRMSNPAADLLTDDTAKTRTGWDITFSFR